MALAVLFTSLPVLAGDLPVKAKQAWIRLVPPVSSDTAAYMTLTNSSDQPLRLVKGETALAKMVMPMITTKGKSQDMMGMKMVDALVVPAHGQLVLAPDGDHLMLMGLSEHPQPGTKVKMTLIFEPGDRKLSLELPVTLHQP